MKKLILGIIILVISASCIFAGENEENVIKTAKEYVSRLGLEKATEILFREV